MNGPVLAPDTPAPAMPSTLAERPPVSHVGLAVPHESAAEHVTGTGLYTDDLIDRLPGTLHAWPVTSTVAHGLITSIDTTDAEAMAGVVRILTAADVPGINDAGIKHDEPLFPQEVMFYGHAIVWVLAQSLDIARAAAQTVVVQYQELPSIITLTEAIEQSSYQGNQPVVQRGDAEAGMAASTRVFDGEFEFGGQEHFYLETHASLASVDEAGQVFVQSSTQHPTETQEIVAHVLGLDSHEVTVQCLRMGGGFGGKEMQPHGFAAIAALGARLTGHPVRVRLNRTLDMTMTGKRHPFHARYRVGFDDDGRLRALQATLTSDGGWSLDLSEPVLARAMCHIDNAYWIPDIEVHGRVARTHKTSQTAFRGFGGPQGMLVIEEILGRVAQQWGIPAHELRRRNFYQPGQSTPYGQPVRHAERMPDLWDALLDSSQFAARSEQIDAFNSTSPHRKRALAITPVKFGISFNFTSFNQAGALVHVYKDGSVLINHGGTEMGQGLHTKMLQVAATALGVPLHRVRLAPTRTDKVPNTSATAASSGADLNGGAVQNACHQIRDRLAEVAAEHFGVAPDEIVFADGLVAPAPSIAAPVAPEPLPWEEVVSTSYLRRVQLWAAGFYRTEGLHWDPSRMQGSPFKYFAYGAAVSEVEVDGFTGSYQLLRADLLHDVGDSLSPLIDVGQVEGGFLQGVGWLTLEELRWDTSDSASRGRLATQAASTYKLPSFSEMPIDFRVDFYARATEDGAVYGSKAVGEPPLMLAFSVREALRQACAAFGRGQGSRKVVELASPATPEAVFWALQGVRG